MEAEAQIISSEFPPDVSPADPPSGSNTSHLRAEFESLLALAEKLRQSIQELSYRYDLVDTIQDGLRVFLLLEVAVGGFIALTYSSHASFFGRLFDPFSFAVAIGTADALLGGLTGRYYLSVLRQARQLKRAIRADERDLSEVVELLREIEPVYAKEEKLSALARVQIRIRLSRFGIGSSSRGTAESAAREQNGEGRARKSRVDQELMKPF